MTTLKEIIEPQFYKISNHYNLEDVTLEDFKYEIIGLEKYISKLQDFKFEKFLFTDNMDVKFVFTEKQTNDINFKVLEITCEVRQVDYQEILKELKIEYDYNNSILKLCNQSYSETLKELKELND